MPPPTVTCKICKQTVLKAQTYHIGNGERACKSHEGVNEKADSIQQQMKEKLLHEQQKKQELQERREQEKYEFPRPHCWFCNSEGMSSQEFYQNLIIHNKIAEIKGKAPDIFSPEYADHVRAAQGLKPGEKLAVISLLPIQPDHPAFAKLNRHQQMACSLGGIVSVCSDCEIKHKIKRPEMKMSFEQLSMLGALMEPYIREEALNRIGEEAKKN